MTAHHNTQLAQSQSSLALNAVPSVGRQVRTTQETVDPDWDAFVAQTRGGRHFQSSLWAQVKSIVGWKTARTVVKSDGEILAGAQMLIRQTSRFGAVGFVSRGPLLAVDDAELGDLVIGELLQMTQKRHIWLLLVQPPRHGETVSAQLPCWGFSPNPLIQVAPTATVMIDLTQDLDEILARMTKRTRQYIRAALRKGINIREGAASDLPSFYRMQTATASKKEWLIYNESYYSHMWRVLSPGKHVRLTFAEYRGNVVSALLIYAFGEGVYGKTIVSTHQNANRGAIELLLWDALRWAKTQGHLYFDLGGVNPQVARAVSSGTLSLGQFSPGPALFKFRLGGQAVFCPGAFVYVRNPVLRWFHNHAFPKIFKPAVQREIRMALCGLYRQ